MLDGSSLEYKDKALIFKKFILYVDVIIKEESIVLGQKLNSFFGQVGIFENTEEIVAYVENYYKSVLLKNYVFNELDFKDHSLYDDTVVYLPLTLIFYYGDKKVDFYVYSSWNKNYINENLKFGYIKNFSILNNYKNLVLNKINFYKKIINYNSIIYTLNVDNYSAKLSAFNKKMLLNFFITEDFYVLFFDEYFNFFFKKKNRTFFFKKIKTKNKKLILNLNKNIYNIDLKFSIYVLITKLSFFDNEFENEDLLIYYLTFTSNLYTFKLNFLKRFKRKKRFKKKVIKNSFGKKFTFYKIFNSIEETKKKKRR